MVADPGVTPVIMPASSTLTIVEFEVVQVGWFKTVDLPSWYVARAVNCCVPPLTSDGADGVITMEVIGAQNSCPPHDVPTITETANANIAALS